MKTKTIKIGVTGGIGSGKSFVCDLFKDLGIPVYNTDSSTKILLNTDKKLISAVKSLIGEKSYIENKHQTSFDPSYVADQIFSNTDLRIKYQDLVGSYLLYDIESWIRLKSEYGYSYVVIESAIFYETGFSNIVDIMIGVDAPYAIRLARAHKRDNGDIVSILTRMKIQTHEENMKKCDFVIQNSEDDDPKKEVNRIHDIIIKFSASINKG
jgi:dephospho-CoA kinase